MDFSNALNTVDRTSIPHSASRRVPCAYNFLRFAYGSPAPLFTGGHTLQSRTGTHQGCPLGPLGFALALQPIVEDLVSSAGLLWSSWYLDDGLLVGGLEQVGAALSRLERDAAALGLRLNRGKCVLWGPGASRVPASDGLLVRSWEQGEGITVLGLPVDRPGYSSETRRVWESARDSASRIQELIARLPDTQVGHHLLRVWAHGCRLNHLLRGSHS